MADSYPDRTNASGLWNINEISKNKTTGGNWPGNFGTPGGRGLFACGQTPSSVDTVDFITISTAGDATDFGNLQSADRHGCNGSGSTTRGLFCGGGSNTNIEDTIDFFTIASTGNATDFGNLTGIHRSHGAFGDQTRCITAGGSNNSAYLNVIEFMTIANTGNGTDFGDLTAATDSGSSGVNSPTRGVIMGGIT
jgi:hypothetical protein